MEIKIGADPEVFVKQNGQFKSAFGLVDGDKENPLPVKNGAVQVDGLALEFNIDPALTEQQFVDNVATVFNQLEQMVNQYEIVVEPFAEFDLEHYVSQPPQALLLGCDADYDAYTGQPFPALTIDKPVRSAGGHIHVGWTKNEEVNSGMHFTLCQDIVKQLDFFVGLPALILDNDERRRSLYGKAGCFRPKPYGLEYRTPSNFWLKSKKLTSWIYRATMKATKEMLKGNYLPHEYREFNIRDIINSNSINDARKITNLIEIEVPNV